MIQYLLIDLYRFRKDEEKKNTNVFVVADDFQRWPNFPFDNVSSFSICLNLLLLLLLLIIETETIKNIDP